jgi:hypothetical protein
LQCWGECARDHYAARGFPVFAGEWQPAVRSADRSLWPPEVVATDAAVVRLTWQLATAVMAHYFADGVSAERLLIYRQLVRHIESLRAPGRRTGLELRPATLAVFRNNLDRARWSLRFALNENGRLGAPLYATAATPVARVRARSPRRSPLA